jgi:hypothetical protein
MARDQVVLSYNEAMREVRDTWVGEARLMIELILGRTDE